MTSKALQLGICTGPPGAERAAALRAAGCDYYEPTVANALMAADPAEFEAHLADWSAGGLEARSANVLLPGDLKIVGPDVDAAAVQEYLKEAMRRAEALGLERIVFGSGTARNVPEGFPREQAYRQLNDTLRLAAELAGEATTICFEHLRHAETNLVNSLAEAGEIVHELDLPNLGLVVDAYHLQEEQEDVAVVREVADKVAHVHVCGPARRPPGPSDEERLAALFRELAAIGYEGRCSIEASFDDLDAQAPAALDAVRRPAEIAGLV